MSGTIATGTHSETTMEGHATGRIRWKRELEASNKDNEVVYAREEEKHYLKDMGDCELTYLEIKELRRKREMDLRSKIKHLTGPRWYQELSIRQMLAAEELERAMYEDFLAQQPYRLKKLIQRLGILPIPSDQLLFDTMVKVDGSAVHFLSELFQTQYGHPINIPRKCYPFNSKVFLSSITHLCIKDTISHLERIFHVEKEKQMMPPPPTPTIKSGEKKSIGNSTSIINVKSLTKSPYLQKLKVGPPVLRNCSTPKIVKPPPLPTKSEIISGSESFEALEYYQKPKKPKQVDKQIQVLRRRKKIDRNVCDEIAGYRNFVLEQVHESGEHYDCHKFVKQKRLRRRLRRCKKKKNRKPKVTPVTPKRPDGFHQYNIGSVTKVGGIVTFIIHGVVVSRPDLHTIHGGIVQRGKDTVMLNQGIVKFDPYKHQDYSECDCMKWEDEVMDHLKNTKCYSNHRYDYHNDGEVPSPYDSWFHPPTHYSSWWLDEAKLYQTDNKWAEAKKTIDSLVDKDSVIGMGVKKNPETKVKPAPKCLETIRTSKPSEYLLCVLRILAKQGDIVASLPNAHRLPVLVEWMRCRMYGPMTEYQKKILMKRSKQFWNVLENMDIRMGGAMMVAPKFPYSRKVLDRMTWLNKKFLSIKYAKIIRQYRRKVFKYFAAFQNLFWASMYQDKFPNEKFREIFFTYTGYRELDFKLIQPYSRAETMAQRNLIQIRKYMCCLDPFKESRI